MDGRKIDQIREIEIKIDYLSDSQGSCLFSRGLTEVLSVVTLGKYSEKRNSEDAVLYSSSPKNFIHHYNFPSFSVGEVSNSKFVSRREIGHGNLVEKSFLYLIPSVDNFPYLTRTVSEVLSADGSSSQASICSSSVALMCSGFPLKSHIAGIALGFFENKIITDIDDLEDRLGETDFKISGTKFGICSLQMDSKKNGIEIKEIGMFLEKGKNARLLIIKKMESEINAPRKNLSSSTLKCKKVYIGKENLKFVIGQKGRVVDSIILKTGVKIDFQDDSYALVYHLNEQNIENACEIIRNIVEKN